MQGLWRNGPRLGPCKEHDSDTLLNKKYAESMEETPRLGSGKINRLEVYSFADRLWKNMPSEMKSHFTIKFQSKYLKMFRVYECNKLNLDKKTHGILYKGDCTYACDLCISKKKCCTSGVTCNRCTRKGNPCFFYTPKFHPEKSDNFVNFSPEYFKNQIKSVQIENIDTESVENIMTKIVHPENITEKRFVCLTRQDTSLLVQDKPDKSQIPDSKAEQEEEKYVKITEKLTSHNDSSIDDSIENIPVVVIEEDERFNNRQNMPVTQSDTNKESFTQLNSSRSSTSHHSVNQVEGLIDEIDEDNTLDEDSQTLQYQKTCTFIFKTMFETIDDNEEIIEASIKLIWMATNGKIVNITFDDPMLSAKVVFDNDTSEIIILDEPEAVLLNKNNYRKIKNELAGKGSVAIDEESSIKNTKRDEIQGLKTNIQEPIQNANPLSHETSNSINMYQSQINKKFKVAKKFNQIKVGDEHDNDATEKVSSNSSKSPKEYDTQQSDEYSDSAKEFDEKEFDNAITSRLKKNKKANKVDDKLLESFPSNLTDNSSSSLPSISEIMNKVNAKTSLLQPPIPNNVPASVLKSQQINTSSASSINDDQIYIENEKTSKINIENERTSIINEPNIGQRGVPFVFVNDPIPEFFVDKSKEPRTSNDSILVEDNDSDEEIEQGDLVRKRKINQNYKASKKAKINNTNITTKHNNESSHGGEQNNKALSEGSSLPSIEVSSVTINSIDESTQDLLNENSSVDGHNNNQQEDILNRSNCLITTIEESSNSNDSEFSELDDNTNLNIDRKRKAFDKKGKEPDTNYKNRTSLYVDKLKELRNNVDDFAAEDPNNLFEMYSQPPEKYFEEASTKISLNPLPSHIKDVNGCLNYLETWDQHFNHCEKVINNQQYKRIELIYSLSKLFFILLTLCSQEQQEESSKKTTNHWKGNNIKTRMYEKLGNKNKRGILMKWTACWRIHHILWVTNITPSELINVDLNATYFLTATNEEYNFLIKELIGNAEFPEFTNTKDKIADESDKLLFNKAIEYYEKENYIASYHSFFYISSYSNSNLSNDAKFWLAKHLEFGYGTSKNEKKVFEYYSQVYDNSKSIYREKARNRLMYCYYYGIGTDKDEKPTGINPKRNLGNSLKIHKLKNEFCEAYKILNERVFLKHCRLSYKLNEIYY
ncbi:38129_t:CDS:10, partial [Gigaspora margarita]